MGKGNRNRTQRRAQNSRLDQHKRQGKILKAPMRTLPNMTMVPWLRDTFPDLVWMCSLITAHGGKAGMELAARFIDCVEDVVNYGKADDAEDALMIDGSLTSFDLVPEDQRVEVVAELWRRGLYEDGFPWLLARALGKYEGVPARWLIDGWRGHEEIVAASAPESYLRRTVADAVHGQSSTATKAKALVLRARFKHGKIILAPEIGREWAHILPRYPDEITEEERRRIEPSIRAAFMTFSALHGREDGSPDPALEWAQTFWRQNWKLYACELPAEAIDSAAEDSTSAIIQARSQWLKELSVTTDRFLAAAKAADPDLYRPDRHEVLTGIVFRLLRLADVMVQSPPLWTTEHGSGVMRSLIEGQIVLRWLIKQDDAALYERFKDYGRGKLKLLKLHLEECRETLDEVPTKLDEQIEYLDELVNRDLMEEFQDISIEGNFAGTDTRKMADQVGMLPDYRFVFAPASSSVHGEWAFLDQYILMTCRNPFHRFHRIPDPNTHLRLGPELVTLILDRVDQVVADYVEAIQAALPFGTVPEEQG